MDTSSREKNLSLQRIVLTSIIFLSFFQLLSDFVESIYLFGLLGTEIPPEIGLVVLFFSPIILIPLNKLLRTPLGQRILLTIAFLTRGLEIILPTRGRLISAGIGFAALFLFFPAYLSTKMNPDKVRRFSKETGVGLTLAMFALILFKAVNSGSDITTFGMFRLITWIIMGSGLLLAWRTPFPRLQTKDQLSLSGGRSLDAYLFIIGLANIAIVFYFVIIAPNIISRWGTASNLIVHITLLMAWIVFGYWWLKKEQLFANTILLFGLIFSLVLVMSILPHQIQFPSTGETGYPLIAPSFRIWHQLPVYLLTILSPVLFFAFVFYLNKLIMNQPSTSTLAIAFSIGGGVMLIMVLSQVFTTVYDYIPVIGPAFRDKFWLVMFIPALFSFLPLAFKLDHKTEFPILSSSVNRLWLVSVIAMTIISLTGLVWFDAKPSSIKKEINSLRAFTYNIQQGFDDQGERNFDGQLKLIRSMSPDIVGLQESDTARIAGGNQDVVAYFANHLNMYSYYGPSPVTGTFGIALLSRFPIENARTYYLFSEGEQVAVIEAEINVGDETLNIFVTHLGNGGPIIQMRQMLELMQNKQNVIAMGDFNFRPYEEQYKITTDQLMDAFKIAEQRTFQTTWGESDFFEIEERIDHIFVSQGLGVSYIEYLTEPESDHPGLFAVINWE